MLAVAVGLVEVPAAAAGSDRKQGPSYQLSLEALGFSGFSPSFLGSGSSMLTLHYMDSSHLLLTFSLRKLVPRVPGDPDTDEDRLVAAEVVDLPSGKIEARTEWHMHDHARYLWSLGRGRFIVRIGTVLYAMSPLANLGSPHPFDLSPFPNRGSGLTTILVSPDYGLVTLETVIKDSAPAAITVGDVAQVSETHTLIDFYRIHGDGSPASPLVVAHAGTVQSPRALYLPLDADGYLWADERGGGHWAMSFDGYAGSSAGLGNLDSSCWPRLQWVSPSEFVALSCRGGDDRIKIASFGLDGHETWEESLGDFGAPTFAFAPASGRFALSHVSSAGSPALVPPFGGTPMPADPADTSHQEVRVYQIASGDLLLKAECLPVIKTAENFDLAPDGSQLAVVRQGNIAIYSLPPLSKQDRADMAEIAKFAPAADDGPVSLHRLTAPSPARAATRKEAPVVLAVQPAAATGSGDAPPAATDSAPAEAPRKPPTLLNPGETTELPGKATKPN